MAIPKGDKEGLFTYQEYLTWPDDERWELIDGIAYDISPAPARRHQGMLAEIAADFILHFRTRSCSVYTAPFDVVFPADQDQQDTIDTVVQPDLVVVCDAAKLTPQGCTGAPDFVLEILSPASAFKDMEDKLHLYQRQGVREYWIVNPANDTLLVYTSAPATEGDAPSTVYRKPVLHTPGDLVAPRIFPDLEIDLTRLFDRDRPTA